MVEKIKQENKNKKKKKKFLPPKLKKIPIIKIVRIEIKDRNFSVKINILICESFKFDVFKFKNLKISEPPENEIFAKEVNLKLKFND